MLEHRVLFTHLKFESFVEYWIERFPVNFGLVLALSFWQEVKFDVGIGKTTQIHNRQVLALQNMHCQNARGKVKFHLKRNIVSRAVKGKAHTPFDFIALYWILPKYFFFFLPFVVVVVTLPLSAVSSFFNNSSVSELGPCKRESC